MTVDLDRDGIFRAIPDAWRVGEQKEGSQSVPIIINWAVTEWYNQETGEWVAWPDGYGAEGYHYIVKKDGNINQTGVDQLAKSIGWNGDLDIVGSTAPPDVVAQITVKSETYEGKTRRKVQWVNPGDFVPAQGASPEAVKKMSGLYGSRLRAAAAAAAKAAKPMAAPPRITEPSSDEPPAGVVTGGPPETLGKDELPF